MLHAVLVGIAAVGTVGALESARSDLATRAAALGPMRRVAVVLEDHAPGEALGPDDVALRDVPAGATPADALTRPPDQHRLVTAVGAGEVLTHHRFADGRVSALAAVVPPRWRAIAIPVAAGALAVSAGDRVDLLAPSGSGRSEPIVERGLVIDTDDTSITVAVPVADVGTVADASLAATLTVALDGPGT